MSSSRQVQALEEELAAAQVQAAADLAAAQAQAQADIAAAEAQGNAALQAAQQQAQADLAAAQAQLAAAQAQAQALANAQPNPTTLSTLTDPFARDLDLSTKAGYATFTAAIKPAEDWKPLDLVVGNSKQLWDMLDGKKVLYSWKAFYVPTGGTGGLELNAVASATGRETVHLTEFRDLVSVKYNKKVTLAHFKAFASWYMGGENQILAERTAGTPLTVEAINPNIGGLQGKVNAYKIQLCISSAIVYHTIKNHLRPDAFRALLSRKDKFDFWNNTEQHDVFDGLIM